MTFRSAPATRAGVAAPWRRSWSRTGGNPISPYALGSSSHTSHPFTIVMLTLGP